MTYFTRIITRSSLALGLILAPVASTVAFAQEASDTPEAPAMPTETAMDLDDAKLTSFAEAAIKSFETQQKYTEILAQTEDEDDYQRLMAEGNNEVRQSIEQTDGITFDEYVRIAEAANADAELGERVNEEIQRLIQ